LQGVRENTEQRIVALFQPHLYSRTKDFAQEFGRAFYHADLLIVTPIYPAREKPIEGVSGKLISDAAIQYGHHQVEYVDDNAQILCELKKLLKPDDVLITIGAGDIHKYGKEFLTNIE